VLRAAVESERRPSWWQFCVLIEPFEKQDPSIGSDHVRFALRKAVFLKRWSRRHRP
jgi:hypothetical protein